MSIYIHIPFCTTICSYCDFPKILYNQKYVKKYLLKLKEEIILRYNHEEVKTIYIGGGTPSCLNLNELILLFDIISLFNLSKTIEFTFECNIESLDEEKLTFLYENKVNRLSLGIQSINEKNIKLLNRHHSKEEVFNIIKLIRKVGFNNINIDLMYGFNNQTISQLEEDIDFYLELNVEHISTYSLIIEKNTRLYINNYHSANEYRESKMYSYIVNKLQNNNFIHYELSNFAKENYSSKHNLTYWNNDYYYGFGLGAVSYINDIRISNTKDITTYLKDKFIDEEHYVDKEEQQENEIILGLRKIKGINLLNYEKKYKYKLTNMYDISDLLEDKYLILKDKYLSINSKYLYISNEIYLKILERRIKDESIY